MIGLDSRPDFQIQKLADSGQCFRLIKAQPPKETELFFLMAEAGEAMESYRLPYKDKLLFLAQDDGGRVYMDCSREDFETVWVPYFDLERDYAEIRGRVRGRGDEVLDRALMSGLGIRILRQDPWECLVSFIISQRKNIPAIHKAVEMMAEEGGHLLSHDGEGRAIYRFPRADEVAKFSDASFERIRLGYREKYIRRLARDLADQPDLLASWENLSDDDLLDRLMTFYGVGIKIASCVALFAYGRLNIDPIDVWMERVSREFYGGEMNLKKYAPYAGLIQQYLFYDIRQIKKAQAQGNR